MRPHATAVLAAPLVGLALLAGCGGTSGASKSTTRSASRSHAARLAPLTATPASHQLEWVIGELNRAAVPDRARLAEHFSSAFLKAVPPRQLLDALDPLAAQGLVLTGVLQREGRYELAAEAAARSGARFRVTIAVSPTAPHLIEGLLFTPLASAISSWSGVDAALERLAPHASIYAGYAGGGEIHALNGSQPGAIGSAFKLYVLGALASAVEHGSVGWSTQLAIRTCAWSRPAAGSRCSITPNR